MHRYPCYILVLLATFVLSGCHPEVEFVVNSVSPGTAEASFSGGDLSVDFPASAGSASVDLAASGDWTACFVNDRAKDWCSVSMDGGTRGTATITFSVQENPDPDDRSAVLLFKCGDQLRTVMLTQKKKDGLLVSGNRFDVGQEGGKIRVEVKSGIRFTVEIEKNARSWIKLSNSTARVDPVRVFEISANDSGVKREGKITVRSGSLQEVVTVYQEGEKPAIVVSRNPISLSCDAQEFLVEVKHNVDVKMEIPSDCDWVKEVMTKSFSTSTFRLYVSENRSTASRSCRLLFHTPLPEYTEEVVVEQAPVRILMQKDTLFIYGVGGPAAFEVSGSNRDDYKFDTPEKWLSVAGCERDPRTGRLRFLVRAEPQAFGSSPRDGLLLVYHWQYSIPDTLRIHQYERYPAFYYTSFLKAAPVPLIDDGEQSAGIVWGDGYQEPYSRDLLHPYTWRGKHSIAIEMRENRHVSFDQLENGMVIDLRELRSK